jgi:exopolysaccharide biosynthesis polyprenyl glycosylphosphotransferase
MSRGVVRQGALSPISTASENPEAQESLAIWPGWARFGSVVNRIFGIQIASDTAVLLVATAFTLFATARHSAVPPIWLATYPVLVLALLGVRRRSSSTFRPHILDELRQIVTSTALAGMLLISLRALLETNAQAAGQTARQWLIAAACLGAGSVLPAFWQLRARQRGDAGIPTLIIGAGRVGHLVARRLQQYPEFGLRPIGFLDDEPLDGGPSALPTLGGLSAFDRIVHQYGAERVIVAFSPNSHQTLLDLIRRCEKLGIKASFVPRLFETMKERVQIECIGSLPLIAVEPTNPRAWRFTAKYAVDRLLAAILVVLLAPLLALIALAVWLSLGRPILFRQRRVGRDGRVFDMLKFRSMNGGYSSPSYDLPPDTAPGGVEGDDRRTRLGTFLRRTSLDELPQLLNVLRGEMSLVGPRPERPEFAEQFERSVHRYGERHRVKAGITGWAQIHGLRGKTSLADRAEWDNYYIENWSVWLDFKILLLTVFALRFEAE